MKINNGSSLKEYIEAASVDRADAAELNWITDLQDLLGSESVITDEDVITRHSYDVWPVTAKWRGQGKRPFAPDVVIEARSVEQVSKILQWANEKNIPVTPWGGGSSVTVMRQLMRQELRPFLVRFFDVAETRHAMQDSSFDKCMMFFGFEGGESIALAEYAAAMDLCAEAGGQKIGSAPVEAWMDRRYDLSTVENLLAESGGLAETIEIAHFFPPPIRS